MFKKLESELPQDTYLQLLFDYRSIDNSKEAFDTQLWYLLNEPRFDGQVEIVKQIKWLFFTRDMTYTLVGSIGNELWAMDEDGELCKSDIDLANLPFELYPDLSKKDFWTWPKRKELAISFIYCFDYCEKNNIELLPKNLLWKKQIQDFLDNHP